MPFPSMNMPTIPKVEILALSTALHAAIEWGPRMARRNDVVIVTFFTDSVLAVGAIKGNAYTNRYTGGWSLEMEQLIEEAYSAHGRLVETGAKVSFVCIPRAANFEAEWHCNNMLIAITPSV
jgi:hypothetical protein